MLLDAAPLPEAGPDVSPEASVCTLLPGASCNPLTQCNCGAGQHCQVRNEALVCASISSSPKSLGTPCGVSAECGFGLVCSLGACRSQCASDKECGGGLCSLNKSGYGHCLPSCALPTDPPCAPGLSCTPVNLSNAKGAYCTVPQASCEFTHDGECDEPEIGTGVCAKGSDTSDCCAAPKAKCDLSKQCGCESTQACTVFGFEGASAQVGCVAPGPAPKGDRCTSNLDCQASLLCVGNICKAMCTSAADCGNGLCSGVTNEKGALVTGLQICTPHCDFATGVPCGKGTVCATFSSGESFCMVQPDVCGTPANGRCDETMRVCKAGTDPECPH
jgi:hypothetical protein